MEVIVTPRARRDVDEAISNLGLPADTWARIARSLRILETFPLAGRALEGRWAPSRFVLGPWPWMILVYRYNERSERVDVVAVHDARSEMSAASGSSSGSRRPPTRRSAPEFPRRHGARAS